MKKSTLIVLTLFVFLLGVVAPALAGSAAIGSVAGSMNASIGGQSLLPNTTIFSGDSVQVKDGVAIIAVGNNSRAIFGRNTVASFLRDPDNEITVLLSQGNVSVIHPNQGTPMRVKAGDVTIAPGVGFKTLGEIAMLNGSVVVTAKEGTLQVDGHGVSRSVAKGQTIVVSPKTADNDRRGACCGGGGNTALEIAAVGAGGAAAVLAGVAMSRAGNANTNAQAATAAANAATSAANAANSTAAAAAAAAASAAAAAQQAAFLAACANDYVQQGNFNSVDQMYGGSQCPVYTPGLASGT
jgi:hypothetical protein